MTHCREPQPGEQFWRKLIFSAAHEAKKTHCGYPTGNAILQRWWIFEYRPSRSNKEEWERSFEYACEMLERDPDQMRAHFMVEICAALKKAYELHYQSVVYIQRAQVLACAGIPTAIARQYLMPLVDECSYEDVAGIDHGDQYTLYDRRELAEAG